MKPGFHTVLTLFTCLLINNLAIAEVPEYQATLLQSFQTTDARQGVAVDEAHFFAINNARISMHDKQTGDLLMQWDGGPDDGTGKLIHLDSGMIKDGLLYASHSNYPFWPMTSSIEVWNASTLEHVDSHSFGVQLGSLTWLDYHNGHWWAAFGNYDKVQRGMSQPYGETRNTTLVKLDEQFNILERWVYPPELHERFRPMSNSGGSWGPDGYLYITGHDHPEIYVVQIPEHGSKVKWLATIKMPEIEGQGIAWDRSGSDRIIWGILKREERVFRFSIPPLELEQD